jgi:phosphocarrier protein
MKEFTYTIKDPEGIHARPAGQVVAKAKEFECHTTLWADGNEYDLKKLLSVMGANVAKGDTVVIRTEGADEDKAEVALKKVFDDNL